jgi:hypothetical protein
MALDGGIFGRYGFDRITSADGATSGSWFAIKAANGADLVLTTGTTVGDCDNIDGDTLISGDVLEAPLTTITVSSGTCYAWRNKP